MRANPRLGWIGILATTGLCSYFGAKAAAVLVMAHTLPAAAHIATAPLSIRRASAIPTPETATPPTAVQRNIFCSDCESPSMGAAIRCGSQSSPDIEPTRSALPLSLTAILQDTTDGHRFAVVHDHLLDRISVLASGNPVPGAGRVVAVLATRMVFVRQGRHEYIDLRGGDPPPKPAATQRARPRQGPSELTRRVADGIRPLGSGKWQIERGALNTVLNNLHQLARQARIVPVVRQGKPAGFRLARVHQGGVYPLIGLRDGDVLEAVNGRSVQSVGQAFGSLASMRHATRLTLSFRREGKPMTFEYAIR